MQYTQFQRGAVWRKWDLHIHTKHTVKNDQFKKSKDFDDFCVGFFKEALRNDIKAIAITDYFNIDNYKKIVEYVRCIYSNNNFSEEEKKEIKEIFILPNVELRMMPSTDKSKLVNVHCLFNPEYVDYLDNDFFGSIEFSSGNKKFKMNRQGLIGLGNSIDSSFDDLAAYKKGIESFVVSHDMLQKLLDENSDFKENTIIAVSNSNKDGASAFNKHYDLFENKPSNSLEAVRRAIYSVSNCIFSGNEEDREYFLGKKSDDKETLIKKFGSLKPCINGSDAHTESKMFKPDKDRYCWIKSDLNFEGLKQIIHEPEDRVKIQTNIPEEKAGYQVIDNIEILHEDFHKQTILLNENLNSIIGGRSTGKSLLLGAIARKLQSTIAVKEGNEDYTQYVQGVLNEIKITWKDGEVNNSRDIEYFPQSYMYRLAKDKKELNKLIGNIIKQNSIKEAALHAYEVRSSNTSTEITNKINKLFQLISDNQENLIKLKEKGDKKGIESEISKLEDELVVLKSGAMITDEEIEEYSLLKKKLISIEKIIDQQVGDIIKTSQLGSKILLNDDIDLEISSLNENLKEKIKKSYAVVKNEFQERWKFSINEIVNSMKNEHAANREALNEINENKIFLKGLESFQNNEQYVQVENKLKNQRNKLVDIERLISIIDEVNNQVLKIKNEVKGLHSSYYESLLDEIPSFHESRESLKIEASCLFNFNQYLNTLKWSINQQSYQGQGIVGFKFESITGYFEHIFDIFERVSNGNITLKGSYDNKRLCQELLSINRFSISYDVLYDGDKFSQMSEGKKAFVILMLLLDFSDKDCPILIDQPEDDLDNRAIFNDLVRYLKTKKKERQIIIVTHNPNIAVGADSELIIVANQQGTGTKNSTNSKFEYVSGSLEYSKKKDLAHSHILHSQGIREHVCEILEGGNEAFKKRERKYSIATIY